jgi:hypothetical protein
MKEESIFFLAQNQAQNAMKENDDDNEREVKKESDDDLKRGGEMMNRTVL